MIRTPSDLEGLRLSRFEIGDDVALRQMLSDRDTRAALFPEMRCPPSVDWALANWMALPLGAEDLQLTVRLGDLRVIGCVRLEDRLLSYFIGRDYWGNGYGNSAVALLLSTVLRADGGPVMRAFADRNNSASKRILENNGFIFSGFLAGHNTAKRLIAYSYRSSQSAPTPMSPSVSP